MSAATPASPPLVSEWEFIAHLGTGDTDAAMRSIARCSDLTHWFPADAIVAASEGQAVSLESIPSGFEEETAEGTASGTQGLDDVAGYSLLAIGQIEEGLDHLEHTVRAHTKAGECHWLGFRLPIYMTLFPPEVKEHPRYRDLIRTLHLDGDSRARLQKEISSISSVTGVEAAPLLDI